MTSPSRPVPELPGPANPGSGVLFCPAPLFASSVGGVSPCLLQWTSSALLLLLVLGGAFGPAVFGALRKRWALFGRRGAGYAPLGDHGEPSAVVVDGADSAPSDERTNGPESRAVGDVWPVSDRPEALADLERPAATVPATLDEIRPGDAAAPGKGAGRGGGGAARGKGHGKGGGRGGGSGGMGGKAGKGKWAVAETSSGPAQAAASTLDASTREGGIPFSNPDPADGAVTGGPDQPQMASPIPGRGRGGHGGGGGRGKGKGAWKNGPRKHGKDSPDPRSPIPTRFPLPPAPVPALLSLIENLLLALAAAHAFEAVYAAQHAFLPDASDPGPILRWALRPAWAVLPWAMGTTGWGGMYLLWVWRHEEEVPVVKDGVVEVESMEVPQYVARFRRHGLHLAALGLLVVELYHRVRWLGLLARIGTSPGDFVASFGAGLAVAAGKLGLNFAFAGGPGPAFHFSAGEAPDGLAGMGGWRAVAGDDWSFVFSFFLRLSLLSCILLLDAAVLLLCRHILPGDPDPELPPDPDDLDEEGRAMHGVRKNMDRRPEGREMWAAFGTVLSFAWPAGWGGRMALLGCVGSLVLGRIVNVQVPLAYKQIVADLSDPTKTSLPLGPLLVFALLKILQNGVMDAVSSLLWVPVSQGITKEVSVRLFDHLLSLGMRWHLKRKPGEIGRIRSRGVGAVVSVLDTLLLRAGPIVLDLVLACAYFSAMFDSVFATIVFGTMAVNLFASFRMSGLRVRHRRAANQLGNKLASKAIDVLGNIETVKYFGNESHESAEYRRAFGTFQSMERRASLADALVNVARVALVQAGMLLGAVECARRVVEFHTYAASDFVLYLTYVGQLYGPINQLQRHYQTLRQSAMQLGSLLELLDEEPEVRDAPGAAELDPGDGGLEFDAVRFTHFPDNPKRPVVVDGVTAAAAPGRTVALVGPSGGGKTTLLKLALRFVDATEGTVRVSGRDVREVTQASLRSAIGVVPQDAALFNASLMDNIRYGRLDATDAEVEEAARSAQIHDKITGFEKGYATVVGERGMRLSGGERQRVAIARAILRNPKVLLLDEATSALDVQTEKAIQEQLHQLSKGRTTLVVAHRLSTIVNADEILVLDEGRIAERGSFEELLALGGLFSSMWQAQLRDPDAGRALAKEAKEPEKPLSPGFGREETDGLQVDEDMGWADIV